MTELPGYSLLEVLHQDPEIVTWRALRRADGAAVRVRFLRDALAQPAEVAAWQHARRLQQALLPDDREDTIEQLSFGAVEVMVVAEDGRLPLEGLLAGGSLALLPAIRLVRDLAAQLVRLHALRLSCRRLNPGAIWVDAQTRRPVLTPAATDPHYLAPEQWSDLAGADPRSDLYALGVLLYTLLTGQAPLDGPDAASLAHAHAARQAPDVRILRAEVPAAWAGLIQRLLAKSAIDRYQTAYGLHADLSALCEALEAGQDPQALELGRADRAAVFRLAPGLHGREQELQTLMDAVDRARWGHPAPFLLRGAPGIGKSALASALRDVVERDGGWFIAGKFDQYKRNVPYSAGIDAFTGLLRRIAADPDQGVARWRQRIESALGANARVVVDVVGELEQFTGTLPPAPALGPVEARNRFNTVFRDFVQLFGSAERPLVILLDDIQWADAASLSMFTTLARDETLQHVLLLGAYRDSEAGSAHLLTSTLDELRTSGVKPAELALGPINERDSGRIVADAIGLPERDCADLAAVVHRKTAGNPFFVRQFLRALHDDGVLHFDATEGRWRWDIAAARSREDSDSVAQLMATRMQRLTEDARAALRVAACAGAVFASGVVAAALGHDPGRVDAALASAQGDGLIEPAAPGQMRFVHDRVQQAAYALIEDADRPALRLRIGQVMRSMQAPGELEDALFEVVNNLIAGADGIVDPRERADLGALCLRAGRRARASMAYEDARTILQVGLRAVQGLAAEREHGFALRSELFECAYLSSRFDEADALYEQLVRDAPGLVEKAHVHNTKILIDTSQGRGDDAVRLAIAAVREYGVAMSAKPGVVSVLWELARVKLALRGRSAQELLQLPPMRDPVRAAAIGLLLRIGPAAYFNHPEAFVLSALKIVRLSLTHGHTAGSSFGYVIYGLVIGAKLGDAPGGHEFGRLAVALSDRMDTPDIRSKVHLVFASFVNFWSAPFQSTLRLVAESFPLAVEAGDPQYGGYCHNGTLFHSTAFGLPLQEVQGLATGFEPYIRQANDAFSVDTQQLMQQRVRVLLGTAPSPPGLDGPGFSEDEWLARVRAGGNLTTLAYYQVVKLQLALLFGDLPLARSMGAQAYANREPLLSQVHSAELMLYYGLSLASRMTPTEVLDGASRRALSDCRRTLARHAGHAASNFEPWHLLLEAQVAAAQGGDALGEFDRAIESATRHGQAHMRALAAELAGRCQSALGRRTVAQGYLRDALGGYEAWQASAKIRHLVQEFAALLPEQALALASAAAPAPRRAAVPLDLEAALGAAHALAEETEVDVLLERLLRIAMAGGGAQHGHVVLQRGDGLQVEAVADADQDSVRVAPLPLAQAEGLCVPVVQTVVRRRSAVVIAEAVDDPQFGQVPDVRTRRPRSIACLPIALRERLLGVLYVENNLAADAFTPERMRLLTLMAAELAMGVDRAQLHGAARASDAALGAAMRRVELLEKSKAHLGKFVPQSVQRLIDANPDAPALEKRERDVSILFLDIEGYTRLTESLSREQLDWLVRTYFSRFLDIVHAHRGDINETAGDGLMIIFQDDAATQHALNAARAAAAVISATEELNASLTGQFAPLAVNVGINSGAALVGATRLQGSAEARYTFTATGSVTNIAARLGAFATGGTVIVSEATALRLGGEFRLESLGPQRLKNVGEPVSVYRLVIEKTFQQVPGHGDGQETT